MRCEVCFGTGFRHRPSRVMPRIMTRLAELCDGDRAEPGDPQHDDEESG